MESQSMISVKRQSKKLKETENRKEKKQKKKNKGEPKRKQKNRKRRWKKNKKWYKSKRMRNKAGDDEYLKIVIIISIQQYGSYLIIQ